MTVSQIPLRHVQAKCSSNGDCGGTCYACTLGICSVCGGMEGDLTTHCVGRKITQEESDRVYEQGWDYYNGEWIQRNKDDVPFHNNPKFK